MLKPETNLQEIVDPPCWRVSPVNFSEFFHHLPKLVPVDSILCLEGVRTPEIESYLQERPAFYKNETNQGFMKMRPKIFYMPITDSNIQDFAKHIENYAEPEVCDHLRIYFDDKIILSWHDLPFDPVFVTTDIDVSFLRNFCISFSTECEIKKETVE